MLAVCCVGYVLPCLSDKSVVLSYQPPRFLLWGTAEWAVFGSLSTKACWRRSRQRNCWMDNVKERHFCHMPELLTMASSSPIVAHVSSDSRSRDRCKLNTKVLAHEAEELLDGQRQRKTFLPMPELLAMASSSPIVAHVSSDSRSRDWCKLTTKVLAHETVRAWGCIVYSHGTQWERTVQS